jgi:hypothetical protein
VTLPMVRGRGKPTTYHNMRVPVQNFCGRDFQVGPAEPTARLSKHVLTCAVTCLQWFASRAAFVPPQTQPTAAMFVSLCR